MLHLRSAPRRGLASGLMCPYCKDSIESVTSCVECESCATWLHGECFRENQGCTVLGCREQRSKTPPVRVARAAAPVTVLVPAPDERGITEVAVALAFIQASALGSIVGIVTAITGHSHTPGLAGSLAAFVAFAYVALKLLVDRCCQRRTVLTGGDRALCILCGLVTGLVGLPLVFFSVLWNA